MVNVCDAGGIERISPDGGQQIRPLGGPAAAR